MVLILSPAKCLVPNKDLFGILGPYQVLVSFGGSACGLFKAGLIYLLGLPESMGSSLNDCVKKSATLCTLYCIEMRISVERICEFGDEERE